jgi:hypothetical protein
MRAYPAAVIRVGFGILALTVTGVGVYLLAIGQPVGGFILTAVGAIVGALDLIAGGITQRRASSRPNLAHERRFVDAFREAQATGVAAEVHLANGEKLLKGVHEVNEQGGFVSLYSPTTLGDRKTTREIPLEKFVSVSVTEARWPQR